MFQSQIVLTMKNNTFFNDRMLPYNQTAEGSRLYSLFLASATKTYPQYVSELHGMADGAEIPFSKVSSFESHTYMKLLCAWCRYSLVSWNVSNGEVGGSDSWIEVVDGHECPFTDTQ